MGNPGFTLGTCATTICSYVERNKFSNDRSIQNNVETQNPVHANTPRLHQSVSIIIIVGGDVGSVAPT